jgi:hypothetical protein
MADENREKNKITVWDHTNLGIIGIFFILFIVGSFLQSFFNSNLVPLVIEPPIVAYILLLVTLALGIISFACCILFLVLWIFTFKKFIYIDVETPSKRLKNAYSICILIIIVSVLQSFYSFLGAYYFAIAIWQFKISVIIASLGLVSIGVCYIGLLMGNFSFKKYIDKNDDPKKTKINKRQFTGRLLLLLTISSVPLSFLAFGWLGLILEWLILLIPFYIIFGTDKIIKLDNGK